jgi:hypothetical protein
MLERVKLERVSKITQSHQTATTSRTLTETTLPTKTSRVMFRPSRRNDAGSIFVEQRWGVAHVMVQANDTHGLVQHIVARGGVKNSR